MFLFNLEHYRNKERLFADCLPRLPYPPIRLAILCVCVFTIQIFIPQILWILLANSEEISFCGCDFNVIPSSFVSADIQFYWFVLCS